MKRPRLPVESAMLETIALIVAVLAAAGLSLTAWHWSDTRADQEAWRNLLSIPSPHSKGFDPAMVADLPEPARRYFTYMIAPGAPLYSAMMLDMRGELGFGDKDEPGYRLPTRVECGNHFGTDDYFPFFKAEIADIRPGDAP